MRVESVTKFVHLCICGSGIPFRKIAYYTHNINVFMALKNEKIRMKLFLERKILAIPFTREWKR